MYDEYFIGDPAAQMDNWMLQTEVDNCAVAAELSIINQFPGDDLSLDDATYISAANGWYMPGFGTDTGDIGKMMDLYGIPTHTVMGASIEELVSELQQGHGVIVGVNSAELWEAGMLSDVKQFFCDAFRLDTPEFNPADHAVVITGIDLSNPDCPMVMMNDSGIAGGAAASYPLDQFRDAWGNSGFYYTSTSVPIPDSTHPSPDVLGFDLANFLGIATTFITGSPEAGMLVTAISDTDWEALLEAI
jgi:hypothetical protein